MYKIIYGIKRQQLDTKSIHQIRTIKIIFPIFLFIISVPYNAIKFVKKHLNYYYFMDACA